MLARLAHRVFGTVLSAVAASSAFAEAGPKVEVVSQIGHPNIIQSVALSPDGKQALSGGLDNTIKLWDVSSGRLLRTFGGHSDAVNSVAFSPVGGKVLSGSSDKTLRLWDASTSQLLRTFAGHSDSVNSVAFSPDGSKVLSGSSDKTLKLWEESTGQLLRTFNGHPGSVNAVAFSSDGSRLLSGGDDKTLKLWDARSGQLLRTLKGHSDSVSAAAFSPDGARLASGGVDNSLKVWDASTGQLIRNLAGHTNTVRSVAFSSDGAQVLSSSSDGTLKLWDVTTGKSVGTFKGSARLTSAALSSDGRSVLAGNEENTVELWDVPTGAKLLTFGTTLSSVVAVAHSPDSTTILSGSNDNTIKVWDAATGRLARVIKASDAVTSIAFSPEGRRVVSASAGSEDPPRPDKLELWDVASGRLLNDFAGDLSAVSTVAFSPDGSKLLTAGAYESDTALQLWDAPTGTLLRSFKATTGVFAAAFFPDGKRLVSAGSNVLQLWDPATGKLLRTIKGAGELYAVAVSPDGKVLVSGSDKGLQSWDPATGKQMRTWTFGRVASLGFSPNGSKLLVGSWDNTIREVDVATGTVSRVLTGHSGKVNSVAFSRDGRSIVSGSDDGTVRLWSGSAGTDAVGVLAMQDGNRLALTSSGFFDFDGDSRKFVHLVRGFDVISLEQVHQSLFSPDLVREALTGDQNGEVKRAAGVVDLEKVVESGPAPDVEITWPIRGTTSEADIVNVSAQIRDRGKGIGRVEWRVNGITAGVCHTACLDQKGEAHRQLALDPGENTIEVVAYNAKDILASSAVRTAVIFAAPPDMKPAKLHVLAIGINDYVDQGAILSGETARRYFPKLGLAVGDAKAVAAEFKKMGEGLYSDVRVRTVLDEEATVANLDAVVTDFAKGISPRDTFILFAAAHGITNEGRFYLIPQDYQGGPDPEALKTRTIDQLKLQDWIANRIKAKKALILLDTCESGALTSGYLRSRVDGPASDASIGRLHEATGRPVLTAAAQGQEAAEVGGIDHGLFTAGLLDGLRHAQTNRDGVLMLSSLAAHVHDIVSKLVKDLNERETVLRRGPAGGEQSVRFGSRGEDFAIVRRPQ